MNPLHCGSSDKTLFGLYHAPAGSSGRNRGVILCNPFGDEAIKAHRAFLQLANRLAAERFHVLRFDYYATGDSAGDSAEGAVGQWLADIGTAADELKDASGVAKVSFVGLRLGATLALEAARTRRDLDRVTLWDPIVQGRSYITDLRRINEEYLASEFGDGNLSPERLSPKTGDEVMGFPLTQMLRDGIAALDLSALDPTKNPHTGKSNKLKQVALITSTKIRDYDTLAEHLRAGGVDVTAEHVPVGINWNSDEAMNTSLVPAEAIEAIVASLHR